jgi:hypothetical protein
MARRKKDKGIWLFAFRKERKGVSPYGRKANDKERETT